MHLARSLAFRYHWLFDREGEGIDTDEGSSDLYSAEIGMVFPDDD
jgi:hypothetical protein